MHALNLGDHIPIAIGGAIPVSLISIEVIPNNNYSSSFLLLVQKKRSKEKDILSKAILMTSIKTRVKLLNCLQGFANF